MKKEALFAIVIGIIVGLGITYAIYQFRQKFFPVQDTNLETAPSPSPSVQPTAAEKLVITSPENEAVLATTASTISGTAESNEMVVIFINNKEYITQADEIGAFAADVTLDSGSNFIRVIATTADGRQKVKELVVVVSTASLDTVTEVEESSPSATVKPSASPKVQSAQEQR